MSPSTCCASGKASFAQIKPLKRGGGRRYYRPEDIALLRRIKALLYGDGYTIKGVQKLLREGGAKSGEGDASGADSQGRDRGGARRASCGARSAQEGDLRAVARPGRGRYSSLSLAGRAPVRRSERGAVW